MALKIKTLLLFIGTDGFYNIWPPFGWEVSLASIKSFTNSKNPSSNLLQEACSGFQVAIVATYVFVIPKAACDSEKKMFPKAC
jgi:hypothetical protein